MVLDISPAPDDFDPRRAARSRVYEYRVLNRKVASAFEYRYSWLVRDQLDLAAMNCAAQIFVGEHDFAAFRSLGSDVTTTVRRVISSEWTRDGRRSSVPRRGNEFSAAHGARDGRGDGRGRTRQADA